MNSGRYNEMITRSISSNSGRQLSIANPRCFFFSKRPRWIRAESVLIVMSIFGSYSAMPIAHAGPMDDLLKSGEVQRLHPSQSNIDQLPPPGVSPSSEYWRLFKDRPQGKPGEILMRWVGEPAPDYRKGSIQTLGNIDFVGVRIEYTDHSQLIYESQIIVPHPRRIFVAETGLIPEFKALESTSFSPDSTDTITIGKLSGTLFTRLSGECLLKVPLGRHAWFSVKQPKSCEEPDRLIAFARTLFLDRVRLKLR
jgi:hypothetical protein